MSKSLFKKFTEKEIKTALAKLTGEELLETATDCVTNAKYYLRAAKLLFRNRVFKAAQGDSNIALEELSKAKVVLDLVESKKDIEGVVPFFRDHAAKYLEIYKQKKYSEQRIILAKQAAYVSFSTLNSRPIMYANEGFENLAKNEIEDAERGIKEIFNRINRLKKNQSN